MNFKRFLSENVRNGLYLYIKYENEAGKTASKLEGPFQSMEEAQARFQYTIEHQPNLIHASISIWKNGIPQQSTRSDIYWNRRSPSNTKLDLTGDTQVYPKEPSPEDTKIRSKSSVDF